VYKVAFSFSLSSTPHPFIRPDELTTESSLA
jgi:hypothetical protein